MTAAPRHIGHGSMVVMSTADSYDCQSGVPPESRACNSACMSWLQDARWRARPRETIAPLTASTAPIGSSPASPACSASSMASRMNAFRSSAAISAKRSAFESLFSHILNAGQGQQRGHVLLVLFARRNPGVVGVSPLRTADALDTHHGTLHFMQRLQVVSKGVFR